MTTARLIRDQNLDVHYSGGAPIGGKTDASKAKKNGGGIGGRKALQDLSNSAKPSENPSSRKKNSVNVLKVQEKTQVGRKALRDLTNSVNRPKRIQDDKKNEKKKLNAVAEEENFPIDIAGECFLHNHQECVKAQSNNLDMKSFLKTVGLDAEDNFTPLASPRALTVSKITEIEEKRVPEELMMEEYDEWRSFVPKSEPNSPLCESPKSLNPFMDLYFNSPNFTLMESP